MIRSFIAIELKDKKTIERILSFSSRLKQNQQNLKLVAAENLHITIKFLGVIQETIAPKIYSILKKDEALTREEYAILTVMYTHSPSTMAAIDDTLQ